MPQDSASAMTTRQFVAADTGDVEDRGQDPGEGVGRPMAGGDRRPSRASQDPLLEGQGAACVVIGPGGSVRAASSARDARPASPLGRGRLPSGRGVNETLR